MDKRTQRLFDIRNPWRKNKGFLTPKNYITRNLERDIKLDINSDDILIVYGSRQVGKTTLLYKLIQYLRQRGADRNDLFYFSADDKLSRDHFLDEPSKLIEFVMENKKKKAYIFIDEIQRISNPGIFLKNLYDYRIKDLKVIVTGSSSLEIKSKIIEFLPGRKKVFTLFPLSFKEILKYKKAVNIKQKKEVWREYIIFGGYPKVFLSSTAREKKRELNDIYESYVKKDISGYLRIEKPEKFNQLALFLADQITGLVNVDELTNTLNVNRATVERYISMLEDTFVIKKVFPFFKNPRTEITKMPKIYFLDLGLRNVIIKNLEIPEKRADIGKLAENFIFTQFEYKKDIDTEINFWRTKSGSEIDFVVRRGQNIDLYEVKYAMPAKKSKLAAFTFFGKKYDYNKAFMVTSSVDKKENNAIPFWDI